MKVVIDDMTNQELNYMCEMIAEKLIDLGHEDVEGFSYTLEVSFETEMETTKN